MAERVGFEPTDPVRDQQFSRLSRSTALPSLRSARSYLQINSRLNRLQLQGI